MLTSHAEARCQQRGIPTEVVQAILGYGRRERRHGADICFMDHHGRKTAERDLGRAAYARLEHKLNSYLVVADDGFVITAAPRLKRLKF